VDHFKHINDTYGHAAGDAVLVEVARRLQHTVRRTDTVARLAGDEFVILLDPIDAPDDALHTAQKVVAAIRPPIHLRGDVALNVTASIGVARRRRYRRRRRPARGGSRTLLGQIARPRYRGVKAASPPR
jgi:diguanylate cyclase (GGDEF)-like protein